MPYYATLNPKNPADRRTAQGLLRLRKALAAAIPPKTTDTTLLLATWNIREFGGTKYDGRQAEPLFYIAEVCSHFDLLAIQEVRDDLSNLDRLMYTLGGWWDYLVTDVTYGRQGNNERLAFVYDKRKVAFGGLAGEISAAMVKTAEGTLTLPLAFARSPYLVGMRAGWFKFSICSGHLYYGDSKPDDPQRLAEMTALVGLLKERIDAKDRWARNAIVLGDFNVFSTADETYKALTLAFKTAPAIAGAVTNQLRTKPFDQIAFLSPDMENRLTKLRGGVFNYYESVYRDDDRQIYRPDDTLAAYREWRSYKMSDHLPLWIELAVDFGDEYLERKAAEP